MSEPQKKQRIMPFDENDTHHPLIHLVVDLGIVLSFVGIMVCVIWVLTWVYYPLPA